MNTKRSIIEIIGERHSNRTYREEPIGNEHREMLDAFLAAPVSGPFGGKARFQLAAASAGDSDALRELGTYGMIKNAQGFIIGAITKNGHYLEDYGYLLERIVLYATGLGLGTCWLGGTFSKSGFARGISLGDGEALPAVIAAGYSAEKPRVIDSLVRLGAGSKNRKPWESIFFNGDFSRPLIGEEAGAYRVPLEMARWAPSASNKQPWRIVKQHDSDTFHFFLERTKNYHRTSKFIGKEDLQRVDMGITMQHFEAAAVESNLKGAWMVKNPQIVFPTGETEYVATWQG